MVDDEGYLTLVDRKKDLIIRGGFNVYPRDVEDELMTHPSVAMAAVIGRPDPKMGEEVVAYISVCDRVSLRRAEELVAYTKERLAGQQISARGAYPRRDPADQRRQDGPQSAAAAAELNSFRTRTGIGSIPPGSADTPTTAERGWMR